MDSLLLMSAKNSHNFIMITSDSNKFISFLLVLNQNVGQTPEVAGFSETA